MGNTTSSDGSHGHHHHGHHHHSSSTTTGGHHGGSGGTSGSSASRTVKSFMRSTGVLGLSRSELDERCKPSGLYPTCQWEEKAIRKLIGDGKLASRLKGSEVRSSASDRECPICFLNYREINVTKCCQANICTECYLQVRPQKEKSPCCPFCNHNRVSVTVAKAMGAEDIINREENEQRVIEAKIRQCVGKGEKKQPASSTVVPEDVYHLDPENKNDFKTPSKQKRSLPDATSSSSAFGSSLEKNERVASLRARTSSSLSDSDKVADDDVIASLAMAPEERRAIEEEMRAQHSHPLTLKIEAEAEERRAQNEREFYRAQGSRLLELRARGGHGRRTRMYQSRLGSDPGISLLFQPDSSTTALSSASGHHQQYHSSRRRDWNQIVDAFERGGNGEVNSLDDLVVLEAAMILSMEEESRRRGHGTSGSSSHGGGGAAERSVDESNSNNAFDASRHAGDGFPLLRSLLAGRQSSSASRDTATTSASDGTAVTSSSGGSATAATTASDDATNEQQGTTSSLSIGRTLGSSSRRRGRNTLLRGYRAGSLNTALDTASLLMRGISEEEQVAMAIAASLQEQQTEGISDNDEENSADDDVSDGVENIANSSNAGAALGNIEEEGENPLEEVQPQQQQNEQQQQIQTGTETEVAAACAAGGVSSSESDFESTSEHLHEQQINSGSPTSNSYFNNAASQQHSRGDGNLDENDSDHQIALSMTSTSAEL